MAFGPALAILLSFSFLTHAQTATTASDIITSSGTLPYCTSAPSSIYDVRTQSWRDTSSVIPPLPCKGWYGTQEGICCNENARGISCSGGTCTCKNGTVDWSMPLASCVSVNPQWSGCPGNMLKGLCCSAGGIFESGEYNSTEEDMKPQCWRGATEVFTVTTMSNGTEITKSLPPGISYTNTLCYTCPISYYRQPSRSTAGAVKAMVTGVGIHGARVIDKVLVVGVVLLAGF